MNPFDIAQGLEPLLQRTGDTPKQFVGRLFGLGAMEQQGGVPKWAWLGVGLIGGGALMWVYGDDLRRLKRNLGR